MHELSALLSCRNKQPPVCKAKNMYCFNVVPKLRFDCILHYRSLSPSNECPGGNNSWESTVKTSNAVICHTELDLCEHLNSKSNGPGHEKT